MARVADPHSKRATVRRLGREFGVSLALEKVYQMMDRLDNRSLIGSSPRWPRARRRSAWPTRRCSATRTCRSWRPRDTVTSPACGAVRADEGSARWKFDPDKFAEAARWDGLHEVATNVRGMSIKELLERSRGLWQVAQSFRIAKHDLKVHPIHHWARGASVRTSPLRTYATWPTESNCRKSGT